MNAPTLYLCLMILAALTGGVHGYFFLTSRASRAQYRWRVARETAVWAVVLAVLPAFMIAVLWGLA